jgi:predicted ArsR family transcriptional regulator
MPRSYTKVKMIEGEILAMKEAGKTRQEIADEFGLTKEQVKEAVKRFNRRKRAVQAGQVPKERGRPRKGARTAEEEKEYELKRLRMENELLRDFLHLAGRR